MLYTDLKTWNHTVEHMFTDVYQCLRVCYCGLDVSAKELEQSLFLFRLWNIDTFSYTYTLHQELYCMYTYRIFVQITVMAVHFIESVILRKKLIHNFFITKNKHIPHIYLAGSISLLKNNNNTHTHARMHACTHTHARTHARVRVTTSKMRQCLNVHAHTHKHWGIQYNHIQVQISVIWYYNPHKMRKYSRIKYTEYSICSTTQLIASPTPSKTNIDQTSTTSRVDCTIWWSDAQTSLLSAPKYLCSNLANIPLPHNRSILKEKAAFINPYLLNSFGDLWTKCP